MAFFLLPSKTKLFQWRNLNKLLHLEIFNNTLLTIPLPIYFIPDSCHSCRPGKPLEFSPFFPQLYILYTYVHYCFFSALREHIYLAVSLLYALAWERALLEIVNIIWAIYILHVIIDFFMHDLKLLLINCGIVLHN